jgi:hypothetical protein
LNLLLFFIKLVFIFFFPLLNDPEFKRSRWQYVLGTDSFLLFQVYVEPNVGAGRMEALDKVPLNYADSNLSKVSAVAFVALVVGADIVLLSIVVGY